VLSSTDSPPVSQETKTPPPLIDYYAKYLDMKKRKAAKKSKLPSRDVPEVPLFKEKDNYKSSPLKKKLRTTDKPKQALPPQTQKKQEGTLMLSTGFEPRDPVPVKNNIVTGRKEPRSVGELKTCLNIVPVSRDKNTIIEIKKAYNALTMRVHPDKNSDPSLNYKFTERFKEVADCYEEYNTMK
jgi:hypothetical protein